MQSDEFAIDHINGLRLSCNSKDIDNKNTTKQKQEAQKHTKNEDIVDDSGSQRHRRHKKFKKKNKKPMNNVDQFDANIDYNAREYAEGKTAILRDHAEGKNQDDEDEVPHRRLKIVSTPVGERRRSSNRRKSHPPGVKTKLPKLPINAGKTREQEEDTSRFPVDEEDVIYQGDVSRGYDTINESHLTQNALSKESDVVYVEKAKGDGFVKQNKDSFTEDQDSKTEFICNEVKSTRLDFMYKMHLRFRSLGIMTNGLAAGLALSQCIFIFSFSNKNLKDDYSELSILFQSIYYLLLTISTVSVLDRYFSLDSDWADFLNHLIARPLRAITLVSYLLSLIFSISLAQLDDSISMEKITSKKLDTWKALNMFRVITSIIGWISVSFSPLDDITAIGIESKKAKENEKVQGISSCEMNATPITILTSHEEL